MSVPVTLPVTASVGPVHLRLFPATEHQIAVDDWAENPWMIGALCRVTFWFGPLRTTKKITTRHHLDMANPSPADLLIGTASVLGQLVGLLHRHGIDHDGQFYLQAYEVHWRDQYFLPRTQRLAS